MKIILLTRSLGLGGAERQLVLLAKGLLKKGHEVEIATFYPECAYDLGKVKHVLLGKKNRYDFLGFLKTLYTYLKQTNPSVVYSFMTVGNLANLITRIACPKAVCIWGVRASFMDFTQYDFFARVMDFLEKKLRFLAHGIIVNSTYAYSVYTHQKLFLIYNGIDTQTFDFNLKKRLDFRKDHGFDDTHKVIAIVGRIDPMKDHETFLKSCDIVYRTNPLARFLIMGGGTPSQIEHLKVLSEKLKIDTALTFRAPMIPPPYESFDVVVSSSIGEGFSNVIGEALSTGIPCVGTAVGETRLLIGEKWCVQPKDYKNLAQKILDTLAQNTNVPSIELRRTLKESFGVETMIEKTLEAFEDSRELD